MLKHIEANKTHKKTAIVSYGTRITLTSKHVRSVDLFYMREYLMKVLGREQVDFVNHPLKDDLELSYYKDIETTDLNDYDEVYIYNCIWNAFGGVFKFPSLVTMEKLYHFNGDIVYILLDPEFAPIDYSLFLKYKNRHDKNYIWNCDNKKIGGKYPIDKNLIDDWPNKVYSRMKVAYAGRDYEKYVELWDECVANKRVDDIVKTYQTINHDVEWFNFWLFEYYAIHEKIDQKLENYIKVPDSYDLVYFGNQRASYRNKILETFYNTPDLKKLWIGYDPKLENTDTMDYVAHDELFKTMGQKCLATLVVGDIRHNNNIATPRFYEAMLLDIVAFIYIDFDKDKQYIKNEFLRNFIYVSSPTEFQDKVRQIKNDTELYRKIVQLERDEVLNNIVPNRLNAA